MVIEKRIALIGSTAYLLAVLPISAYLFCKQSGYCLSFLFASGWVAFRRLEVAVFIEG